MVGLTVSKLMLSVWYWDYLDILFKGISVGVLLQPSWRSLSNTSMSFSVYQTSKHYTAVYYTMRQDFTALESYYVILCVNDREIKKQNSPFMLQSYLPWICACMYLFGQRSTLPNDIDCVVANIESGSTFGCMTLHSFASLRWAHSLKWMKRPLFFFLL